MSDASGPATALAQAATIFVKDVRLEWRSRARLNAVVFFAMLTLLLFSFAVGPQSVLLARLAPGFVWLAVLLSGVLALGESLRAEGDNMALEGLCLLPVRPGALFVGKACANALFLFALGVAILPVAMALYGAEIVLPRGALWLGVTLALGCGGISAPGTLYAALSLQARARDVMLPLLLFPVLMPNLIAAVKATTHVCQGDPMHELPSWLALLGAFNVAYWLLGTCLFGRVIEQ